MRPVEQGAVALPRLSIFPTILAAQGSPPMPYKKPDRLGSFRRFALAFWKAPTDGTIYGTMFIDATKMLAAIKKAEVEQGIKLTPGHIVGKAMALGLRAAPQLNSKVIW